MSNMSTREKIVILLLPWAIWGISAFFYCQQYFLRVSVSTLSVDLSQAFHITAFTLSNIASAFFYAYVILQIPSGILIDRYGTKNMLMIACMICAIGCFIFIIPNAYAFAIIGRLFMGAGAAFALTATLKLSRVWFSEKTFKFIPGMTMAIGAIGATLAGAPLAMLREKEDWRLIILIAGVVCMLLLLLIWLFVEDVTDNFQEKHSCENLKEIWQGIKKIAGNKILWMLGFYLAFVWLPLGTFAILWGTPFLLAEYKLPVEEASFIISFLFLGWALGAALSGFVAHWFKKHTAVLRISSSVSLLLMLFVLYSPHPPIFIILVGIFFLGAFLGIAVYALALVSKFVEARFTATAYSFTNLIPNAFFAIMLPLIGFTLDYESIIGMVHNVHIYTLANYHIALAYIPIAILFSVIISFFIHEPVV